MPIKSMPVKLLQINLAALVIANGYHAQIMAHLTMVLVIIALSTNKMVGVHLELLVLDLNGQLDHNISSLNITAVNVEKLTMMLHSVKSKEQMRPVALINLSIKEVRT
jgi:hypothetical protein